MEGMGNQIEMDGFDKLIDTGAFVVKAAEIVLIGKTEELDGRKHPGFQFYLKGNATRFVQPFTYANVRDQYFNAIVKKMNEL